MYTGPQIEFVILPIIESSGYITYSAIFQQLIDRFPDSGGLICPMKSPPSCRLP